MLFADTDLLELMAVTLMVEVWICVYQTSLNLIKVTCDCSHSHLMVILSTIIWIHDNILIIVKILSKLLKHGNNFTLNNVLLHHRKTVIFK